MNTLLNSIKNCKSCSLCENQSPLIQECVIADIMWVGLSAVRAIDNSEIPLSSKTNSGKLIESIELLCPSKSFYKTNLVKCLPLDHDKIRYPSTSEMKNCFPHLKDEIQLFKPKLVFLLGKQVASFVLKEFGISSILFENEFNYSCIFINNILYVPIHHPSYILVYKRKQMRNYISSITDIIDRIEISNKIINLQSILLNGIKVIPSILHTTEVNNLC